MDSSSAATSVSACAQTEHGFVCANAGIDLSNVEAGRAALAAAAPGHAALVRSLVFEGMSDAQARAVQRWLSTVAARVGR